MDLPEPIHDFLLIFLGSGLVLVCLEVVLFTNQIFSYIRKYNLCHNS